VAVQSLNDASSVRVHGAHHACDFLVRFEFEFVCAAQARVPHASRRTSSAEHIIRNSESPCMPRAHRPTDPRALTQPRCGAKRTLEVNNCNDELLPSRCASPRTPPTCGLSAAAGERSVRPVRGGSVCLAKEQNESCNFRHVEQSPQRTSATLVPAVPAACVTKGTELV